MIGWYKPQVGGGSHVIQNLVKILKKEHKVYIINMEESGLPIGLGHWNDDGVDVYQEKIWYPRRYTAFQTLFQTTKRALLLRKKVDIYHTHGVYFSGVGLIDRSKPMVLTIHGYSSLEAIASGRIKENSLGYKHIRFMEKKVAQRADAIIAVGKTLRQWIIEELRADPEKVFYIPNGIDSDVFRLIPPEDNPLKDKIKGNPILIFTKHFSPGYGAKDLILAFKDVVAKYPDARLIMLGEDKWKSEIINYSKKLGVFEKIVFPGRVPNEKVPYFLSISDIFINPISTTETFGISVIEAMACETPVVATAVGGPKEIMDEGIRQMGNPVGILVPPKSPDDLAKAILEIIDNYDEAKRMAKRAREYVLKNYTWDIVAKKTLKVYECAIMNHK